MLGITHSEESGFTDWYFKTDRRLLGWVLLLIFVGVLCVISAGSVQAIRKGWAWYYFLQKMLPFYFLGVGTLLVSSMFNRKWVLGVSGLNVAVCFLLLLWTVIHPVASHGSERWADLGFISLMPSDIMKPGLVIITAWFLSKMQELYPVNMFLNKNAWRPGKFSWLTYFIPFAIVLLILFMQPDVGTTLLFVIVVGTMLFVAGLPTKIWAPALGGFAGLGFLAFLFHSHVHKRVMTFLFEPLDPRSQVGLSIATVRQGGLFGMRDEAFAKEYLPDAHTDFIFATLVEDWGAIVACGLLVLVFLIVRRLMLTATTTRDKFVFYAICGTTAMFATQVCINLATTLGMMPPKGMTLPFISSGGSSFLGYCLLFGMVLALIREDKWK
ncbi:MAG: FtsW/RodA/SpoVE family cell cycle protein [Alphaproteobacteria bacterium]